MAFLVLQEKVLPSKPLLVEWSPDKDLLALATADLQLALHRITWQRVWAVNTESPASAITWRPDGRQLTVGLENGSIELRDVETGDIQRTIPSSSSPSPILHLSWILLPFPPSSSSSSPHSFRYHDRTGHFFPPPSSSSPSSPTSSEHCSTRWLPLSPPTTGANTQKAEEGRTQQPPLLVLCSLDASGLLVLSAFGVFPFLQLTASACGSAVTRPLPPSKALLSSDLSRVTLVIATPMEPIAAAATTPTAATHAAVSASPSPSPPPSGLAGGFYGRSVGGMCMLNCALPDLASRTAELSHVSILSASISDLLARCSLSLKGMEEEWRQGSCMFRQKVQELGTELAEEAAASSTGGPRTQSPSMGAPSPSPSPARDELLCLLATGTATSAMQNFLGTQIFESSVKRMAKSLNSAVNSLHLSTSSLLQPALEEALFRLDELCALSRLTPRFGALGLSFSALCAVREEATTSLVHCERLLRLLAQVEVKYNSFFVWLLGVLRALNEEVQPTNDKLPLADTSIVADFLNTEFDSDSVARMLADKKELGGEQKEAARAMCTLSHHEDLSLDRLLRLSLLPSPTASDTAEPPYSDTAGPPRAEVAGSPVADVAVSLRRSLRHQFEALHRCCSRELRRPLEHLSGLFVPHEEEKQGEERDKEGKQHQQQQEQEHQGVPEAASQAGQASPSPPTVHSLQVPGFDVPALDMFASSACSSSTCTAPTPSSCSPTSSSCASCQAARGCLTAIPLPSNCIPLEEESKLMLPRHSLFICILRTPAHAIGSVEKDSKDGAPAERGVSPSSADVALVAVAPPVGGWQAALEDKQQQEEEQEEEEEEEEEEEMGRTGGEQEMSAEICDIRCYKDNQLALLVRTCSSASSAVASPSRVPSPPTAADTRRELPSAFFLALLPLSGLVFSPLQPPTSASTCAPFVLPRGSSPVFVPWKDLKRRKLPPQWTAPSSDSSTTCNLAVSGARGLVCAFSSSRNIILLDLEEEDDNET